MDLSIQIIIKQKQILTNNKINKELRNKKAKTKKRAKMIMRQQIKKIIIIYM